MGKDGPVGDQCCPVDQDREFGDHGRSWPGLIANSETSAAFDALAAAHVAAIAALAGGDPFGALLALDEADAALGVIGDPDPVDVVNVALARVRALRRVGRFADAVAVADAVPADALGDSTVERRLRVHLALERADTLRCLGRYDEAGPLLTDALGWAQQDLGPADDDTAAVWNSLGVWHRYRGEREAAFAAYDQALAITAVTCGVDSPDYASVLHNIASLHQTTGTPADGEEPARRAIAIREAALGPDHPDAATDIGVLGVVLADLGRYDEAAACYARTREILTSRSGPATPDLAYLACNEAALQHLRGALDAADTGYLVAERLCRAALGDGHPQVAAVQLNRATLAVHCGNPGAARHLASAVQLMLRDVVPADHPHRRAAVDLLASIPTAGGDGAGVA